MDKINFPFQLSSCFVLKENSSILGSDIESIPVSGFLAKASPSRVEEFRRGRFCALSALSKLGNYNNFIIEVDDDRSPVWPKDVVGSISHSKAYSCSAVASCQELIGIGVDLESSARVKEKLARMIKFNSDVKSDPRLSTEELLSLIFSAKESFYKALYPQVKCFFGFEDAAVTKINESSFSIELLKDLSDDYKSGASFNGLYSFFDEHILTIIEIKA